MKHLEHIPHPSSHVLFFIFLFILLLLVYYTLKFLQMKRKYALATSDQQRSLDTRINATVNENLVHQNKPANTWQGFKNFRVIEKKIESWTIYKGKKVSDICSFILEPTETPKPLPAFPKCWLSEKLANTSDGGPSQKKKIRGKKFWREAPFRVHGSDGGPTEWGGPGGAGAPPAKLRFGLSTLLWIQFCIFVSGSGG